MSEEMKAVEVPAPSSELDKELSKTNKEKFLKNLEREVKAIAEQTADVSYRIELMVQEKKLHESSMKIVEGSFKMLRPNFSFEQDAQFEQNAKDLTLINYKRKLIDFDINIKKFEGHKETLAAQVKQMQELIDKTTKELAELN